MMKLLLLLLPGFFGDWPDPPKLPPGSGGGWQAMCARTEHVNTPATLLACQESEQKARAVAIAHQEAGHISAYWQSCVFVPAAVVETENITIDATSAADGDCNPACSKSQFCACACGGNGATCDPESPPPLCNGGCKCSCI